MYLWRGTSDDDVVSTRRKLNDLTVYRRSRRILLVKEGTTPV